MGILHNKFFEKFVVSSSLLILWGYIGGNPSINLNKDYREILSENIAYELENEEFSDHSKDGPDGAFSRDRKLTIRNLIVLIINFKEFHTKRTG